MMGFTDKELTKAVESIHDEDDVLTFARQYDDGLLSKIDYMRILRYAERQMPTLAILRSELKRIG